MQNVFNRHFPFGKIKVRLSFRVRDNVVTMTHRGRHEQVTVSGVSLKYQNQTGPCFLVHHKMCSHQGKPQVYPTPWIHCQTTDRYRHRCWSPEDRTGHGCGGRGTLREEISGKQSRLLLPFISHLNRPSCFDSGPDVDVHESLTLRVCPLLTRDRRRICSWAGQLTWAFYRGRPVQI